MKARGVATCVIEADLARAGTGREIVDKAIAALGGIDILVVCASIQSRTPFLDITADEIERQVQINFRATVELLQAALPPMKERGWGRVLTIGSVNQVRPDPELAIYAALKSAQYNLCINLAKQYAPFNVMINNLSPGLVATERNRWRRQDAEEWRISSPPLREGLDAPRNPTRWSGLPCSFARMPPAILPASISW